MMAVLSEYILDPRLGLSLWSLCFQHGIFKDSPPGALIGVDSTPQLRDKDLVPGATHLYTSKEILLVEILADK